MKETDHIVSEIIRRGEPRDVVIEEDNLIKKLVNDDEPFKGHSTIPFYKGLSFLMIIATLVAALAIVLHYSFIYLKDVLMSKNELYVNSEGAFTPKQAIGREYGIYLFNTSDLWANSGIRITKGDKVRISISGAFHSSYADLMIGARDNTTNPEIDWIGKEVHPDNEYRIIDTIKLAKKDQACLYNMYYPLDTTYLISKDFRLFNKRPKWFDDCYVVEKKKPAHLGDILYEIAPEYTSDDPLDHLKYSHVWSQDVGEKGFTAKETGYLRFAVNDIYFKDSLSLRAYPINVDSLRFGRLFDPELILDNARTNNQDFRKVFYTDNVGQILVCVEIQHHLKRGFWNPMSAYRFLDKKANKYLDKSPYWGVFLSFLVFVFVFLPWVTLIFAVWALGIFAFIAFVYLLFFAIPLVSQNLTKRKEKPSEAS